MYNTVESVIVSHSVRSLNMFIAFPIVLVVVVLVVLHLLGAF